MTWDVWQSVQPNTHDIDQGIHAALAVPTTDQNNGDLNCCIHRYIELRWHQVLDETSTEWSEQGELFKEILQRVILPTQFKAATPSKCKIICMWIDGLHAKVTWVTSMGTGNPNSN